MSEQWLSPKLPEKIEIKEVELKVNSEGKKYKYEKDGSYYGGDYLEELPQEIDIDLPPPPTEENSII